MAMSRGEGQYNSILAMKLKLQMDQQAQEKAEALQREQLADQKLQGYLNTMNQTGQLYYQSARARDKEERERVAAEIKHMREFEKEMRDRQQHKMDQLQDWDELLTQEKGKKKRKQMDQSFEVGFEDYQFDKGYKRKPWTYEQELGLGKARAARYGSLTPPQENTEKQRRIANFGKVLDTHKSTLDKHEGILSSAKGNRRAMKAIGIKDKSQLEGLLSQLRGLKKDLGKYRSRIGEKQGLSLPKLEKEIAKANKDIAIWMNVKGKGFFGAPDPDATGDVAAPGATPSPGAASTAAPVDPVIAEYLASKGIGGATPAATPTPTPTPAPAPQGPVPFEQFSMQQGYNQGDPNALPDYYQYLMGLGLGEEQINQIMQGIM